MSSLSSDRFIENNLEALKLSAFLETEISARRKAVDKMAALGAVALPYLKDLIRSLGNKGEAQHDFVQYCYEKLEQLASKDRKF